MNLIQVVILAVFFSWLCSLLKNNTLRLIAVVFSALLVGLEITALYLTDQLIDDRFINHLGFNQVSQFAFQFKTELVMFMVGWLLLTASMYWTSNLIKKFAPKTIITIAGIVVLLALMSLPKGILPPLWNSIQIAQANEKDLDTALKNLGINPLEYIKPHQIQANPGKNIIVISLESIEQGFLKPPLNDLTPHLTRLAEAWTYFNNMPPIPGSDWTAGSLYTLQTGFPALFDQSHLNNNNLFQNSQSFQLTSLNHVLQKAGYETRYLIGKPEFGGMQSMLETVGIQVVSEKNSLGQYPPSQPGLHDLDLFNEAKLQIKKLANQKNTEAPFALFMSTINTHFPDGILDDRMLSSVDSQNNNLKTMVTAVDFLVNDFLDFIEQQELLDDTVIYFFPDHTLMGNVGEVQSLLKQNKRQLYLLTSAEPSQFKQSTDSQIDQTDLPQLILQGAGIETNAKFLSDFINQESTKEFIKNNDTKIAAVNNVALNRQQFNQCLKLRLENNIISVSSDDQQLNIQVQSVEPTEIYQVTFSADMVPLQQQQISLSEALTNDYIDPRLGQIYLNIYVQNGEIYQAITGNRFGVEIRKSDAPYEFTVVEINQLKQQINQQAALYKAKKTASKNQYATDQNRFIAHAGGAIDGHKYTNSLEALNFSYQQGFKLFELDFQQTSDGQFVAVHDWPQWQRQTDFNGELPPDLKTFIQQPILGKYTALDMATINQWFDQHPDAILVTDKVNSPAEFVPQFTDSKRLMMELFTWSAVKQAKEMDLKAVMPTGDLIVRIPNNKIAFLNNLGIETIVASRRWIDSYPHFIQQLNFVGIDIFAFHIGFDKGKDETHVVCHERNSFYGLYADEWDFKLPQKCR